MIRNRIATDIKVIAIDMSVSCFGETCVGSQGVGLKKRALEQNVSEVP